LADKKYYLKKTRETCANRVKTREAPIKLLIEEKKVATKMPSIMTDGTMEMSTMTI
jgi:hypothetical protein